jgi:general secretion pathway protein L
MNQILETIAEWGTVLRDSLPAGMQRILGLGRRFVVIEPGDDGWILSQARGAALSPRGSIDMARLADQTRRMEGPVVLVLPEEIAMRPVLTLPGTARRSLDQVLEVEIERLTPFKAPDVAVARDIRPTSDGQIMVKLTIVSHPKIEAHARPLRDAGVTIDHIVVGRGAIDRASELSLIADTASANQPARWVPRLVTAILLLGAVASPFVAQEQRLRDQQAKLDALQSEVAAINRLTREVEALDAREQSLRSFSQGRLSMTELLEEISRVLPDHTWLARYQYEGARLTLEGRSASATSLVAILNTSSRVSDVRFGAPVTRDPGSGADRFRLNAAVSPK